MKRINREISWLLFNGRVLQEAEDSNVPLLERLKFLAIFSSNLDEFFRVRVASLRSLLALKKKKIKGLDTTPERLLSEIHALVKKQQTRFGKIYASLVEEHLPANGIFIQQASELNIEQQEYTRRYFHEHVVPLLQIETLEKERTPFLNNRILYFCVRLIDGNENALRYKYVLINIPSETLGRFITLPLARPDARMCVTFLDDIIRLHVHELFPTQKLKDLFEIKLTRDAELYIEDEFTGDIVEKIRKGISKRPYGVPSRFLYDRSMPASLLKVLRRRLKLSKDDLIPGGRYHNFHDFFSFPPVPSEHLHDRDMPPLSIPQFHGATSVLRVIAERDVLAYYPYHSYRHVIRMIEEAADDPNVESILITLYRTASDSKVISALLLAAKNGKSVTAFVEIKARFDEETNLRNAEELQRAGVRVLYSLPGLKVHAKMCLITYRGMNEPRYLGYLSTGNFNEKTARLYTDIGLFTADPRLTGEMRMVFDHLFDPKLPVPTNHLLVAHHNMRDRFNALIDREIREARRGRKARIIVKMNSLEDDGMMEKLEDAVRAGVQVTMIIRGICCLVPDLKEDKNFRALSIIDRFLEHARLFIFHHGGKKKYFAGSADWMHRNLKRRIEVQFPIYDPSLQRQIDAIIEYQLNDNTKSRLLTARCTNAYKSTRKKKRIRAQTDLYSYFQNLISA